MDKRQELYEIDTNVMRIAKHKWFGDVLVAQERGSRKWVVFWPATGRSEPVNSYRDAVSRAKNSRSNPSRAKLPATFTDAKVRVNEKGKVEILIKKNPFDGRGRAVKGVTSVKPRTVKSVRKTGKR